MKSVHLTTAWHASSGGVATFYRALVAEANRRRHQIRLIVPGDADHQEEMGPYGRIYTVRAPRSPFDENYRFFAPQHYLFPWTQIARILQAEQPDLLEVCDKTSLPYLASYIRSPYFEKPDRPTVVGLSCERLDDNVRNYLTTHPLGQRFASWFMKSIYFPAFDHHFAVSDHTASELQAASKGHKLQRAVWIRPMGVDNVLFHPGRKSPEARQKIQWLSGEDESTILLLYAGRLATEKNLDLLADTMDHLATDHLSKNSLSGRAERYHLLIAGGGADRERFQARCERTGVSVTFLGHLANREFLADLYANVDIFLHPNPREPFGIAPLEAMAAGTPVVLPRFGGLTSFANSQNAWLTDPTGERFADAVQQIVQNPELRRQRTTAGRKTAEDHSWPAIAGEYLDLYQRVHLLRKGGVSLQELQPAFCSTPGNWLGREVS
jgi:alpha-1,6-mannosyltransferase